MCRCLEWDWLLFRGILGGEYAPFVSARGLRKGTVALNTSLLIDRSIVYSSIVYGSV